MINRKNFLKSTLAGTALFLPGMSAAYSLLQKAEALPLDLVKDFVIKGHSDLDGVKTMLEETPTLLNATWDWGGGDFETALGGASHMGRPDIAQYLIDQGARMDIFAAAMMGKLEVVEAIVSAFPAALHSKGAHGISLMTHALKGGEGALKVVEFLQVKGIKS